MDFLKELTLDFGQNLEISPLFVCLFFDKMGPEVIFDDHVVRKQAILDYKNIGLYSYQIGLKGG